MYSSISKYMVSQCNSVLKDNFVCVKRYKCIAFKLIAQWSVFWCLGKINVVLNNELGKLLTVEWNLILHLFNLASWMDGAVIYAWLCIQRNVNILKVDLTAVTIIERDCWANCDWLSSLTHLLIGFDYSESHYSKLLYLQSVPALNVSSFSCVYKIIKWNCASPCTAFE